MLRLWLTYEGSIAFFGTYTSSAQEAACQRQTSGPTY